MTEPRKVKVPCKDRITYDKELAIFKDETLNKIEEFRKARSEWITSKNLSESVDNSENKGAHISYLYKGRCGLLRKMGFNTKRMRRHYKTLRPLRYYTLRIKLSESELSRNQSTDKKLEEKENKFKLDSVTGKKKKKTDKVKKGMMKEDDEQKTEGETAHQDPVSKGTDHRDECSCEAILYGNKKKKKWKKGEKNKKKGPSQRAIENLKAATQANRYIESCKCNDGKEMTVVIKGFCPCDNLNLNQLKLNKVCNKYFKSQKPQLQTLPEQEMMKPPGESVAPAPEPPAETIEPAPKTSVKLKEPAPEPPVKTIEPDPDVPPEPHSAIHLTDSLTFHKKILAKKHVKGEASDEQQPSLVKFPRAVSFGKVEVLEREIEMEEKKKSASITTIFKNYYRRKSHMALTKEQYERLKEVSEEKKKSKSRGDGKIIGEKGRK